MDSFSLIPKGRRGNVVGVMAGGVTIIIMIVAAVLIVGTVENNTIGTCTTASDTQANATTLTSGGNHTFVLTSPVPVEIGNISVAYAWAAGSCNLSVNGYSIGQLDGTSPDDIAFNGRYLAPATTVEYACSTNNNITAANLTYTMLDNCTYSYEAYVAMANTTDMTWSSVTVLGVVILVMFAMVIIAAVMTLGG